MEKLKSNISWNTVFIKVEKIKDVKLKWLQMPIIHRIIATNIVLNKMGVTANTQCGFCNDEKDSIVHMFWKCACIRRFWTSLETIARVLVDGGSGSGSGQGTIFSRDVTDFFCGSEVRGQRLRRLFTT